MLTVLLATRNRSRILHDVLEEYCQLLSPPSGWKLVVIDNGSADETAQVISSYANRIPLESVFEPRLGQNHARNAGLRLVEGDLIVFADDDIFPHADWLVRLREAADGQPEYSMFGGVVVRRWQAPPPAWAQWLDDAPVYSKTDPLLKDGQVLPWKILSGNMCIRAGVFQSAIQFDPSMGPQGTSYPMGSETELLLRLGEQGHKAWHVHGAVVEHLIQASQLNKTWVAKRAMRFGRGQYRLFSLREAKKPHYLLGIPRRLFLNIPKFGLRMAAAWMCFQEDSFMRNLWRFHVLLGEAIEARTLARRPKAQAPPSVVGDGVETRVGDPHARERVGEL